MVEMQRYKKIYRQVLFYTMVTFLKKSWKIKITKIEHKTSI
jgi:hypothetical protein